MKDTLDKTIDFAKAKLSVTSPKGAVTIAFNNAAIRLGDHHHPAMEFAETHNMPTILGQYHLPPGVCEDLLQDFALSALLLARSGCLAIDTYQNLLDEVWSGLCGLNPALKNLNLQLPQDSSYQGNPYYNSTYHAIMGVGDQFNKSDIDHFLQKAHLKENRASRFQKRLVESQLGPVYWRPSPETLSRIQKELKVRKI